jgi:uncharacterized repeat protein (TIGR01451 family)
MDGRRTGNVSISDDAANSPQVVPLSGTGTLKADARLSMGATPNPVRTSTNLTYAITVANGGPTAAAELKITDSLPANVQFVSVSTTAGWACSTPAAGATGMLSCALTRLGNGATATLNIVVKVVGQGGGTITNTADVATGSLDPTAGNNRATVSTSIYGRK